MPSSVGVRLEWRRGPASRPWPGPCASGPLGGVLRGGPPSVARARGAGEDPPWSRFQARGFGPFVLPFDTGFPSACRGPVLSSDTVHAPSPGGSHSRGEAGTREAHSQTTPRAGCREEMRAGHVVGAALSRAGPGTLTWLGLGEHFWQRGQRGQWQQDRMDRSRRVRRGPSVGREVKGNSWSLGSIRAAAEGLGGLQQEAWGVSCRSAHLGTRVS